MQIGLHVSISGSIANAVTNAVERECSAFQIFTGNPRGWYSKDLTNEDKAYERIESAVYRKILMSMILIGLLQLHICHICQIFPLQILPAMKNLSKL